MALVLTPQKLLLGADDASPLDLADRPFAIDSMTLAPGAVEFDFVTGDRGDGVLPVGDPVTGPILCSIKLKVLTDDATTLDDALQDLHRLALKVADVHKRTDGMALDYKPPNATTTSRLYAVAAAVTGLPMDMTGSDVGWFHGAPVVTLQLTCKPYIYGEETTASTASGASPRTVSLSDVGGDVDAEGSILVTDTAGERIQFVEWGLEHEGYDSAAPHDLDLTLASGGITATGYSGTVSGTEVQIYPSRYAAAMLGIEPITLLGTKRFAVSARAFPGSWIEFRMRWRVAGGAYTETPWVSHPFNTAHGSGDYAKIELGAIYVPPDNDGNAQEFSGVIEVRKPDRSVNSGGGTSVGAIEIMPAERYGVARAPSVLPSILGMLAFDDFSVVSAALNATTADLGGSWTTGGSATDFACLGDGTVKRSTIADATDLASGFTGIKGRIATLAVTNGDTAGAGITFNWSDMPTGDGANYQGGVILRYSNSSAKNAFAFVEADDDEDYLTVWFGSINSVISYNVYVAIPEGLQSWKLRDHDLDLTINKYGDVMVFLDEVLVFHRRIDALASGGANSGSTHLGFFDGAIGGASAGDRLYSNFRAYSFEADAAMFPNNTIEFTHDDTVRESEAGGEYGAPRVNTGARVFIPPAGDQAAESRIVTRSHGIDPLTAIDLDGPMSHSVSVTYRERFRLPRGQ